MPGEEKLLRRGEPAPFDGVLLPPGVYKGSIDEIDRRYNEIYGIPPAEQKPRRGIFD